MQDPIESDNKQHNYQYINIADGQEIDALTCAKQKIVDWYCSLDIENPSVILPIQQLTHGYLYPHALPVLDKEESIQLKHFLHLVNRITLLHLPDAWDKDANNLFSVEGEPKYFTDFFINLQTHHLTTLNDHASKEIRDLDIKLFGEKNESNTQKFIRDVIAYEARAEHGNKRDDYGCLRAYIETLKNEQGSPKVSQRQLNQIINLRSELIEKRDKLNVELKRIKRDINRYLCDINHKELIRNTEKLANMPVVGDKPESNNSDLFQAHYTVKTASEALKNQKIKLYRQKHQAEAVSKVVSNNVAFGEGVVPAVAMFTALSPLGPQVALPVALLCGISGGVFNKFLVQADTFDVLKKLFFKDVLNRMSSAAEDYQFYLCESEEGFNNKLQNDIAASTIYVGINCVDGRVTYSYKGKKHNGEEINSPPTAVLTLPEEFDKLEESVLRKKLKQGEIDFDPDLHNALKTAVLRSAVENGFIESLATKQLKKDAAIALGGLSLTTGLVYGALSAMNLYARLLMPLLLAAKVSLGPATAIGLALALPPVALTALGFFSIYFFMITDLIQKERWIDIKNYFLKKFVHVGWSELHGLDLVKQIMLSFFDVLKLIVVVGVASTVSFFSFRLFHEQVVSVASGLLSMSNAQLFGYVITAISTTICYLFNIKKVGEMANPVSAMDIVSGFLLLPLRVLLLAFAAANGVAKLAIAAVAMLPYVLLELTRLLFVTLPVKVTSVVFALLGVTAKLIEHVFTGKLLVNLLAAAVVTPLVLMAASWAFAWKCVTVACYLPVLAFSALTFGKIDTSPAWQLLAAISKTLENPALVVFRAVKEIANLAEQYSKKVDDAKFNQMSTQVDAFVAARQTDLATLSNQVTENNRYVNAKKSLFGLGVGVFSVNNSVSPLALTAQGLSSVIKLADAKMRAVDEDKVKQPDTAKKATVADCIDNFEQAVGHACYPAVTPNSGGQAFMFASGQAYWWQRLLVLTCSYTTSAVPNVLQARDYLTGQCSTGPKPA